MRPLKLVMQAFGSYGNRTEIDFEKPDQNLFLITGNTGSGKTTIFDAIVFALYGEASSNANKKNGAELQSQFVEIGTEPFVSLTFSEKNGTEIDLYTVKRIPRHVRPLKRGSGEKMVSEEVSLTMPDGSEYPAKETDAKLMEIVGLTKEQFMQVAMIAQGEFMELLRAKSDDKKITEYLNSVREEVILYTGLNYNIDEIESLKRDLTLYLDMEVLFDIYGYNGKVFQKLALDLFKLARDANSKEKKGSIQIF